MALLTLALSGVTLALSGAGAAAPPASESAYVVLEVTDLAAPRPTPFRVKAIARRDGRAITRILWPEGDRGATLLVTPDDSAVYFPRADLLVASPRVGAEALAGPLSEATAGTAWILSNPGGRADRCDGAPCLRLEEDATPAGRCARLLAWKRPDGRPIRAVCVGARGEPRWELRFPHDEPRRARFEWLESGRLRARGRIVFLEQPAHAPADLFTREGLRRWR